MTRNDPRRNEGRATHEQLSDPDPTRTLDESPPPARRCGPHDDSPSQPVSTRRHVQRAYGVPRTRGSLVVIRPGQPIQLIPADEADAAARKVVRATQGPGKHGKSM